MPHSGSSRGRCSIQCGGSQSPPGSLASVILPELAAPGWWRDLLHNGRSLHVRRILQFEPRVIVSSVPYPLGLDPPLGRFRRETAT